MTKFKVYYNMRRADGVAREHSRTYKAKSEAAAIAKLRTRLADIDRAFAIYAVVAQ